MGQNVLALHGLNSSNVSSDLVLWADLRATQTSTTPVPATIYYTIDGGDPMSPGATLYTAAIPLATSTRVKARSLVSGSWSAVSDAVFSVSVPLRVTEVMYHPREASGGETSTNRDDYEFIELRNISTHPLDLSGFRLADGVEFTFGATTLAPREYIVVASNPAAFAERYGSGVNLAGQYTLNLANGGETVALVGPVGEVVQTFSYDDAWYPESDGGGRSLIIADDSGAIETWNQATAWRTSREIDGSPGKPDTLRGDANGDDRVDHVDLAILQLHFGQLSGASRADGDLTGDGAVNRADAAILARNFGRSYPDPDPSQAPSPPAAIVASGGSVPRQLSPLRTRAVRLPADSVDEVLQSGEVDGTTTLTATRSHDRPRRRHN